MFEIVLIAFLTYRNSLLAKQKEQNMVAWGIFTVLAFFIAMLIGFYIVLLGFDRGAININQFSSTDPKTREALQQQILNMLSNNPLQMITIDLFGIGGYLLVRYLLERKPGKKEPEVHWMDKLGGGE
jgi:hypothetical protein